MEISLNQHKNFFKGCYKVNIRNKKTVHWEIDAFEAKKNNFKIGDYFLVNTKRPKKWFFDSKKLHFALKVASAKGLISQCM